MTTTLEVRTQLRSKKSGKRTDLVSSLQTFTRGVSQKEYDEDYFTFNTGIFSTDFVSEKPDSRACSTVEEKLPVKCLLNHSTLKFGSAHDAQDYTAGSRCGQMQSLKTSEARKKAQKIKKCHQFFQAWDSYQSCLEKVVEHCEAFEVLLVLGSTPVSAKEAFSMKINQTFCNTCKKIETETNTYARKICMLLVQHDLHFGKELTCTRSHFFVKAKKKLIQEGWRPWPFFRYPDKKLLMAVNLHLDLTPLACPAPFKPYDDALIESTNELHINGALDSRSRDLRHPLREMKRRSFNVDEAALLVLEPSSPIISKPTFTDSFPGPQQPPVGATDTRNPRKPNVITSKHSTASQVLDAVLSGANDESNGSDVITDDERYVSHNHANRLEIENNSPKSCCERKDPFASDDVIDNDPAPNGADHIANGKYARDSVSATVHTNDVIDKCSTRNDVHDAFRTECDGNEMIWFQLPVSIKAIKF